MFIFNIIITCPIKKNVADKIKAYKQLIISFSWDTSLFAYCCSPWYSAWSL